MKNRPAVSIVMPLYRNMPYLPAAINSILNQTFQNWELIIIYQSDGKKDDGGKAYLKSIPKDKRIKIEFFDKPLGIVGASIKAFDKITGKYLLGHPGDDVSTPNRLKTCYDFLENNPDYVICCGSLESIDKDGKPLQTYLMPNDDSDVIKNNMNHGQCISSLGAMWRNIKPKYYPRKAVEYAGDYDYLLRLIQIGKIKTIKDITLKHRRHSGSSTTYAMPTMIFHEKLVRLSNLKRLQGLKDFLDDYKEPITDWQVLFNNIKTKREKDLFYPELKHYIDTGHITDMVAINIIKKNTRWYFLYKKIYYNIRSVVAKTARKVLDENTIEKIKNYRK